MALSWLHRFRKRKSGPVCGTARTPFGRNRFLPSLEALGERIVPSTFHVTTLADSGDGSLRAAVAQADAHPGADNIVFDDRLTGTIALTGGELDLTDDLKLNGPGADKLTVSGGNLSRVFQVEAGETVSISGLTIAGGNAGDGNGGGIDNFGALTVRDSVFSGNSAINGGGLENEVGGTATVIGSTFTGNSSFISGGGIDSTGTLTVSDSTFAGNSARFRSGGGLESAGTLTVSGSNFTGNSATRFGAGLVTFGTAAVRDSTFTNNNFTARGGRGGGITNTGTLTVSDSTFAGNSAFLGGGIDDEGGTLTVIGSTFTGNSATTIGGGIGTDEGT